MSDAGRGRRDCLAIEFYNRCRRCRTTSKRIERRIRRSTRPLPRTTHGGSASVPPECPYLACLLWRFETCVPAREYLQSFWKLADQKFQETLQLQTQHRISMRAPPSTCSSLFRPSPEEGH